MIELKELKNRSYDNETGKCIAWDYFLDIDLGTKEGNYQIRFMFRMIEETIFEIKCFIPSIMTDVVYSNRYNVPKRNMPIQTITAMGFVNIQYMLKEEIQLKSTIDFCIGDIIRGM